MQNIVLEFENREELDKAYSRLWDKYGLTGETEIRALDKGRWVMEIHAEKNLRESVVNKLNAKVAKWS